MYENNFYPQLSGTCHFLLNPDDLSFSANLSVYIGLISSVLLFLNMFVATRINKKKKK